MKVLRGLRADIVTKQLEIQLKKNSNGSCGTICQPYSPPEPTPCGSVCMLYCVGK